MTLLVVEDERKTAGYLKRGLSESGFNVDVVMDGDDGLHAAMESIHQLIILDLGLPRQDGWSVLVRLRSAGVHTPVIILTARDAVADRVRGLELGADDYLVKPFAFSELLARVRTVLRRGDVRRSSVIEVADLCIEPVRHCVTRNGQRIDLTAKEFSLLLLLAEHVGEVLTRTHIAEAVWNMNFDSDTNVVDVAIRRLRRKIDEPFDLSLIHTVRGVGYRLTGAR